MATAASPESIGDDRAATGDSVFQVLEWVLSPLASLKLTVVLFAFSLVIVLVGTLAQSEMNIWEVKSQYFESYVTYVEFNVLMPKSFFPNRPDYSGGMFLPGGALIGLLLIINLISAHVIRFKVRARGNQLVVGLLGMAVGCLITAFVIMGGHSKEGIQDISFLDWSTLWLMLKISLVLFWFLSVYALIQLIVKLKDDEHKIVELSMVGAVVGLLTLVIGYLLYQGSDAALGDSSMRILWQLIQGLLCGIALLFGAVYLFNQRAGIVVMHLGVALLMISELFVSLSAVEQQMTIFEGETANFARDIRTTEIAFVAPGGVKNVTTVVPRQVLEQSARSGGKVSDDKLPVDMVVLEYLKNSDLKDGEPGEGNRATAGAGQYLIAENKRAAGGAESTSDVDFPSLYVEFFEKKSGDSLGVFLLSTMLSAQDFEDKLTLADGQDYFVSLRFKRAYKPYSVKLLETNRVNYAGTSKAQSYDSIVRIEDTRHENVIEERIWMNNPLRLRGETFYQSGHDTSGGRKYSVLSVVTNMGWMMPYIACMIVGTGMFYHFGLTLRRYLGRRQTTSSPLDFFRSGGPLGWISAVLIVAVLAGYCVQKQEKLPERSGMDLAAFSSIPVLYEGRYQPIDTLARNTLKVMSDREYVELYYKDEEAAKENGLPSRIPAVVWLLDVISDKPVSSEYRVFRIDHPEVQKVLALEHRKGHRYSVSEILENFDKIESLASEARSVKDKSKLTVLQRRVIELTQRTRTFMGMVVAFRSQEIPEADYGEALRKINAGEELDDNSFRLLSVLRQIKESADGQDAQLAASEPPLLIPDDEGGEWIPYATAKHRVMFAAIVGQSSESAAKSFSELLTAYRKNEGGVFNRKLGEFRLHVRKSGGSKYSYKKLSSESSYNRKGMFGDAMVLYFIGILLPLVAGLTLVTYRGDISPVGSWINRLAFLLIVAAFVIHSAALYIRVDISGRPPVTNLYSSAIFIGWGCVLLGLILELFSRYSIGNLVAAVSGFATLIIANKLSGDGDTMKVLVAVLDTQFWLATHVVCITLGYATTFLAGLFGALFILGGVFTPALTPTVRKEIARMTYAILCFSISLSFVGTVLGGLWADDSWGRFWGWDPKENGALMIVIWNALVLHARWGAMIKERGLAVLSVGGMIVTAWSWFGVNELGVGLHSYGFTDGVLLTLAICVGIMSLIIAMGVVPQRFWISSRYASTRQVAAAPDATPRKGPRAGK